MFRGLLLLQVWTAACVFANKFNYKWSLRTYARKQEHPHVFICSETSQESCWHTAWGGRFTASEAEGFKRLTQVMNYGIDKSLWREMCCQVSINYFWCEVVPGVYASFSTEGLTEWKIRTISKESSNESRNKSHRKSLERTKVCLRNVDFCKRWT